MNGSSFRPRRRTIVREKSERRGQDSQNSELAKHLRQLIRAKRSGSLDARENFTGRKRLGLGKQDERWDFSAPV